MPVAKRSGRGRAGSPSAKKARVTDPIEKKVESLIEAFQDPEQVGLVEMPEVCRSMLTSVLKTAIGPGAAKDERHRFQTEIAELIGDTFTKTVKIWEGRLSEAASSVEAAEAGRLEKEASWSAAESALEAKSEYRKTTQHAWEDAVAAVSQATCNLTNAQQAVDAMETEKTSKEEERTRATTIYKDHFEVLKSGEGDKKLLTPLSKLLKELKAEGSLVNALGSTFAKKPEDRGQFDNMVVQQLDGLLTSHIEGLNGFLDNFEKILAEKQAAVGKEKTMLEEAEQRKSSCMEADEAANKAKCDSEVAVQEAKDLLAQYNQKLDEQKVELSMKEGALLVAKHNLETFTFLHERVQVAPEPATEKAEIEQTA